MESLAVLVVGFFLIGLILEVGKVLLKATLYLFQVTIAITKIVSFFSALFSLTGQENIGIKGVCSRIDGCPIVDGVCIGCD